MNATRTLRSVSFRLTALVGLLGAMTGCAADMVDQELHPVAHRDGGARDGAPGDARTGGQDGGAGSTSDVVSTLSQDICDNGVDDDGNGMVDDYCACVPGMSQRCFAGSPSVAGAGACAWGRQTCVGSEIGTWGPCVGSGAPSAETCDAVDNNCDGRVDEGCACTIGSNRDCYVGPPGTLDVGLCRGGTQACMMEAGNAVWGRCIGSVIPQLEVCDHIDNNCDGRIDEPSMEICDGVDNNCDGHIDETCLCRMGQTPTFHRVSAIGGGSGVTGSAALFQMTCESMHCPEGQAAVISDPRMPGSFVCVPPPPPSCAMGQQVDFVMGALTCVPCEIVIQYGAIYNNARICTDRPHLACPSGETPTFVYESRTWACRPTCDNGLYDQIHYMGVLVCVPC